jgi:hypothetical protein
MTVDPEMGGGPGGPGGSDWATRSFDLSPLISQPCIVDDHRDHPTTTSNQPLQGESNFGDSSGPLFTMYSKAADEEDN